MSRATRTSAQSARARARTRNNPAKVFLEAVWSVGLLSLLSLLSSRSSAVMALNEGFERSALRATAIGEEKTNEAPTRLSSLLSAAAAGSDRRLDSTLVDCPNPANVDYEVTFTVRTLIDPVRQCTETELTAMRNLIDYHFNQLAAHDDVLGAIDFTPVGPSCPIAGSRRLLPSSSSSAAALQQQHSTTATTTATTTTSTTTTATYNNETELLNINNDNHHEEQRKLIAFLRPGYRYFHNNGECRSCPGEIFDKRRSLTTTAGDSPIFIIINTDNNPQEMSYEIQTTSGQVVFSRSSFAKANYQYEEVVYLNGQQQYRFIVKDSFGDGWCCSHGTGKAAVYAGTDRFDVLLVYVNHNFGAAKTTVFRAPVAPPPSTTDVEAYITDSAFPELEYEYSNYISYYIQQAYHSDTFHCMFGKYPDVWVDLDKASASTAAGTGVCPP